MSNVLEETELGLLVGPEPYLATCGRCGARLPMPEMPMKMSAFMRLLKGALNEHVVCLEAVGETTWEIAVIEWPDKGSAKWWVVESTERGYYPLLGPFHTEGKAKEVKASHEREFGVAQ